MEEKKEEKGKEEEKEKEKEEKKEEKEEKKEEGGLEVGGGSTPVFDVPIDEENLPLVIGRQEEKHKLGNLSFSLSLSLSPCVCVIYFSRLFLMNSIIF